MEERFQRGALVMLREYESGAEPSGASWRPRRTAGGPRSRNPRSRIGDESRSEALAEPATLPGAQPPGVRPRAATHSRRASRVESNASVSHGMSAGVRHSTQSFSAHGVIVPPVTRAR